MNTTLNFLPFKEFVLLQAGKEHFAVFICEIEDICTPAGRKRAFCCIYLGD